MRPPTSEKTNIPLLNISDCPAKTRKTPNGTEKGCSVEAHLSAAWMVGKALLDNYHKNFCTYKLFSEHDLIAPLLHDIGKISPAFHDKIAAACHSKPLLPIEISDENHCVTSSLVLKRLGLENLAWVAASHHGRYCNTAFTTLRAEWLGGDAWEKMRENLIQKLCAHFSTELSDISADECKRTLVLGLTILADWLSSGMDLRSDENPTPEICADAVRNAGFQPFSCKKALSFGKVFQNGDAPLLKPNFFQREIAENVRPGAVYILEVEMGSGKTEAALYLAYKLISEFQHCGLYFALPTCLTSEKIYDRVKPFLENILRPESFTQKVRLLHGKAWMRAFLSQAETGEKGVNGVKEDGFFHFRWAHKNTLQALNIQGLEDFTRGRGGDFFDQIYPLFDTEKRINPTVSGL